MARKRGMQYIQYDYEAAYNKAMEDMHEWFIENLFQHRKKVIYALKEITAGDQFEIEIYPQFRSMDEVPPEGRTIKKDNNKAQKNLNDKNARKYVERLINENFSDRDIWMTLTYDDEHLPPDGDVDAANTTYQQKRRSCNRLESAVQRRSFCSSISNRLLHHSKRMQRQQVRGTSTTHLRQSISKVHPKGVSECDTKSLKC